MSTQSTQKSILARLSTDGPTLRRELVRYFQHRSQFKEAYAYLLDTGQITELGTGRANDPVLVYLEPPDEKPDYSNLFPFVTKIPRAVYADFVARCVLAGQEPEHVLIKLLEQAIVVPNISQNVDRGY